MVPSRAILDLKWWRGAIRSVSVLHPKPYTHFLTTDAADSDWGAQLDEIPMTGTWTSSQMRWHSNRKEMFAVYAAIRRQASQLKNAHILVQSDNRTLVAYIRNEGGTRSLNLLDLTCKLLTLTDRLNICLSLSPGKVQLHCRSPFKRQASARVALAARSDRTVIRPMGHSRRRPFRVGRNSRSQGLCLIRLQRSLSDLLKRLQPLMEFSAGVDISSSQPVAQGVGPLKQCQRSVCDNSTSMGEDLLDARSKIACPGGTSDDRESSRSFSGRIVQRITTASRPANPSDLGRVPLNDRNARKHHLSLFNFR